MKPANATGATATSSTSPQGRRENPGNFQRADNSGARQDYALLLMTDISAQKRVEEQLRESNALLEKRQKEIEAELSLAARVQQSLAPRNLDWR
jgi:hypothetical protein